MYIYFGRSDYTGTEIIITNIFYYVITLLRNRDKKNICNLLQDIILGNFETSANIRIPEEI
jgi:hypothetical protein